MTRRRILNIEVDDLTLQEFLERFDAGFVVTTNVDHLVVLQSRPDFLAVYRRADFATVDSQIVKWALGFLGTPVKAKLSGSDLFPAFCNFHGGDPAVTIFLLGGKDGVAETAAQRINARVGRRMVVGWRSPSMSFVTDEHEVADVIAQIEASGANVLAVGLGAPKQELWIDAHRHRLPSIRRFMAVGATLDFEAGSVQRAPAWVSEAGMEWLHRLLSEPGRLWHRYLVRDPRFLWLVLLQRFGLYRDPYPPL
jgi:N-acetylglucosaminyldiphosphoundecaprenol N-acetyl-beta-D-mannosaminyltransferase